MGSLKLTVAALIAGAFLVFIGTMVQTDLGLYEVQERYFRSLFIKWSPGKSDFALPVFPGGYLIGAVLLVNLIASLSLRLIVNRRTIGLLLVHAGIILLLAGQLVTDMYQVESHMRLSVGQPANYSESGRLVELAVIDSSNPKADTVISIPQERLESSGEIRHGQLPFTIQVRKFYSNSRLNRAETPAARDSRITKGLGTDLEIKSLPLAVKSEERNLPSAIVELKGPQGVLGSWLASVWIEDKQPVEVGGKTYQLVMRFARYYKDFSLELKEFRHDKYQGTEIPRNFSSRVRLRQEEKGEDREALIFMNNPLRYGGETFYQSGYDENDPRVSILQVVQNPGWRVPYISCLLVTVGLLWQFIMHLVGFLKERKNT
jgi:hypothetical protein